MARNTTPPTGDRPPGRAVGLAAPGATPSGGPLPGQRIRLDVEGIGAGGVGVGRVDGFTVLVPRALAGETIDVVIGRRRPSYAEGATVALLQPSAARIEPPCAHFADCGGCDWQHVAYGAQLQFKRQVIQDQLRRIGKLAAPPGWRIEPANASYRYRDRVDFSLLAQGPRLRPAFHRFTGAIAEREEPGAGPSALTAIEVCHLIPERFMLAAHTCAAWVGRAFGVMRKSPIERVTVQSNMLAATGAEATVEAGDAAGIALTLHAADAATAQRLRRLRDDLVSALRHDLPELNHLALLYRESRGQHRRRTEILLGPPALGKAVHGRHYRIPPDGFFQVHLDMAGHLVSAVLAESAASTEAPNDGAARRGPQDGPRLAEQNGVPAADAPTALDLFCGVGLFALPLAEAGYRAWGVEVAQDSVLAARDNARRWGLAHAQFVAGNLSRPAVLRRLERDVPRPALVVVDPPRTGLPEELTSTLLRLGAPRLLYVSCDGGTFARDAARLAPRYQLQGLRGFDMFPQTHHVELLGTFMRLP